MAYFKPFKVAFRAYKYAWNVKNHGSRVKKEDLASCMSLALKKALTSTNISAIFRKARIWPLNIEAMKDKMGPSEGFVPQSVVEVRLKDLKRS